MSRELTYLITEENIGTSPLTIHGFLKGRGYSHAVLVSLKKTPEGILKNGVWARVHDTLSPGDRLLVRLAEEKTSDHIVPRPLPFPVIYEDEDLLIVNKPAGLAVDGPDDDTLLNRALLYLNQQGEYKENDVYTPALCHRLDTGTSGLVIIAKTPEAEELFLAAIKSREVKKTYLCVTFGRPTPPDATLGGYLLKDADRGIVKIVEDKQPGAKDVETRYETIAVSGRLALLKVQLITGRTHQIRAHMASIGCPILGDSKYGNNTANRELKLKYQALCAWELTMPHFNQPDFEFLSGKTFHAPKPWYYQQVLDGTLK
mgnify:CR=1 FL=1